MADFTIKVGDRLPVITSTLSLDGAALDLTGCTVRFHMRAPSSTTLKVDAAATVVTAASGAVEYEWALADTDTRGTYLAEWEITYASGKTLTVPNDGYLVIDVTDDLD